MVPKMEACLRAVAAACRAAHVDRRPGAALAAAGDLHRRRGRHDGRPVMTELGSTVDRASAHEPLVGTLAARHDGQLRHAAAGAGPRRGRVVWDADGRRVPRPARRHRGQLPSATPTRPWSPRSPARSPRSGTSQPLRRRAAGRAGRAAARAVAGRPGRVFFGNSGAEANEAAFKLSRRTGRTKVVATEGGFHGRTMGALALTGKPANRRAVRAAAGRGRARPVRRRRRAGAPRSTTRPRWSSWSRSRARTASSSRRPATCRGPARSPPRTARCCALDEVQTGDRPDRALVRPPGRRDRRRTSSRWPRGSAAACRSAPASPSAAAAELLAPGTHGTTFGGNPVAAPPASPSLDRHRARRPARPRQARSGSDLASASRRSDHPLVAGVRGAGLLLGSC